MSLSDAQAQASTLLSLPEFHNHIASLPHGFPEVDLPIDAFISALDRVRGACWRHLHLPTVACSAPVPLGGSSLTALSPQFHIATARSLFSVASLSIAARLIQHVQSSPPATALPLTLWDGDGEGGAPLPALTDAPQQILADASTALRAAIRAIDLALIISCVTDATWHMLRSVRGQELIHPFNILHVCVHDISTTDGPEHQSLSEELIATANTLLVATEVSATATHAAAPDIHSHSHPRPRLADSLPAPRRALSPSPPRSPLSPDSKLKSVSRRESSSSALSVSSPLLSSSSSKSHKRQRVDSSESAAAAAAAAAVPLDPEATDTQAQLNLQAPPLTPLAPCSLIGGPRATAVPCLTAPPLALFAARHLVPRRPAVLRRCIEHWPARRLWCDPAWEYLRYFTLSG
jgi:hypothetical protein